MLERFATGPISFGTPFRPAASGRSWTDMRPICFVAVVSADIAALATAAAVALVLPAAAGGSGNPPSALFDTSSGMLSPALAFGVLGLIMLAFFAEHSHYSRRVPFWTELRDLLVASVAALLFSGCAAFLLRQNHLGLLPVAVWAVFPAFALAYRYIVRKGLSRAGLWQLRTILISDSAKAKPILAALKSEPQLGYDVVATLSPTEIDASLATRRWQDLMQQYDAGLIVLTDDANAAIGRGGIEALVRERVAFAVMPQLDGLPVLGFEQTRFLSHDLVMFTYRNNLAQPVARLTKMAFDVVAASLGVIMLAPVLLVVAAMVKLDGGPVFYSHTRIGSGGRAFGCLKFRSMTPDSDAVLRRLLAEDPAARAEWADTRKLKRDPRITRIGRFLRSTSLDELPQLFNVLRLEMSLVGPRPIVGAEIARYGADISYYYETRPGLTGLWQVSGRADTSYVQRVQLDTWYVKNWTIWHDLAILAKTLPAVLQRRGAC